MIIHNPILTGSFTVNGTDVASITSSAANITAINSYTASQNILNGTYATTGSNTFNGIQTVNSNLVVTGSITAATLVVQTITSSVIYSSGSNVFGNNIANTQVFTGSVSMNPGGLFVSSSGLVGIGTSTPSYTLDVSGTGRFTGIATATIFDSTSNAFRLNGNNALSLVTLNSQSVVKINAAGFWGVQLVGANDKGILIDNTGNVGIGTSSPDTKLHVVVPSGVNDQAHFRSDNATSDIVIGASAANTGMIFSLSGQNLAFGTASSERMRITSGGNLLVGTTTDSGQALVVQAAKVNTYLLTTTNNDTLRVQNNSASLTANANLLLQTTGIGAGTTAFFIYGELSGGTNTFRVYNNGNVQNSNNSYTAISDIKLKENIVNTAPKLEDLLKVRIVNYNLKEPYETHKQIGVIAQELEQIFPALVEETQDKDADTITKSVKYSVFVPILIKAIQELNTKFEEYKATHP
jgi:hypothetical protein